MSDIKRIGLTTLEPQKVSEKQSKKSVKTIRISVILPESNEDNCPEYNYKDELAAVKKRAKLSKDKKESNNVPNGLDPFGDDDDDDVRRIAMQMEEKYGTSVGGNKKKRKGRKDDYADIGMGYDESDSFIDNTDGYDEIIPQNVTTLHGGFYINSGALEFKTDDEATSDFSSSSSDSDNETVTENNKSTNRKRVLETTDEEDEEEGDDKLTQEEKKQKTADKNSMQQAIKKKLFSQDKILVKKRRLTDPIKKTVKELLREKRQDLNMSVPENSLIEDASPVEKDDLEKESHKENKKPMCLTSVDDAIETVVKANLAQKSEFDNNGNNRNLEINSSINKDVSHTLDGESSHDSKNEKVEIVKLPENLPADILEAINSIKQAASDSKEGKVKFFTEEVNLKLLSLERKCRCLGKSSRSKVYEHLAPFVRCKKETLVKRAKNLVFEDEQKKLKKMLVRLKAGIDEIMPSLLANHEKESQKVLQKRFSHEGVTNEESKSLRMPHRKFQWSEDLRKIFKDIIAIKRRCLFMEGKPKEGLDEIIMGYLKTDIQVLWPDGWMSLAALRKACNIDIPVKKPDKPGEVTKVQEVNKTLNLNNALETKVNNEVHKHSQKNSSISLNSNLQIIPVTSNNVTKSSSSSKNETTNEITVSYSSIKPSQKLPEKKIISSSEPVEIDEHKFFDFSKTIQLKETSIKSIDNSVIVSTPKSHSEGHHKKSSIQEDKKDMNAVIIEPKHCQIVDLTDTIKKKPGPKSKTAKPVDFTKPPETSTQPVHVNDFLPKPTDFSTKPIVNSKPVKPTDYSTKQVDILPVDFSKDPHKHKIKHPELGMDFSKHKQPELTMDLTKDQHKLKTKSAEISIVPNYQHSEATSEVDDIQKVMENLKTLQKLSSPSKSGENSISSPVSVIAFNKNFSPKNSNVPHSRNDYKQTEFGSGFQDEFQKQLMNSLTQMSTPTSSKSNYNRCS